MPQVTQPTASSYTPSGSGKPRPKERGCFQCSRRRIVCDKGTPSCQKCIKKVIGCFGLNRIRFAEGVARRGRFKDCKIPVHQTQDGEGISLPTVTTYPQVRWRDQKYRSKRIDKKSKESVGHEEVPHSRFEETTQIAIGLPHHINMSPPLVCEVASTEDEDVEEIVRGQRSGLPLRSYAQSIQPWIAPLSAEARMLFSHCKGHDQSAKP